MTESESKTKRKRSSSSGWLVLVEAGDGLYSKLYAGPDKQRARSAVAAEVKEQTEKGKKENVVFVHRVSKGAVIGHADLALSLPKDAF